MPETMWAIVLAGGEGSRLRALARDQRGLPAPKQFCPLGGRRPPLAAALERAERLVPRERIVVSVVEAHRGWWADQLADREPGNIVSQPHPRGTAAGVLLPLLRVLARDPEASVLVLPADHAVEDEAVLAQALGRAAWVARQRPGDVVLLGVTPTSADPEFGWVVPAGERDADSQRVASFVEKPGPELARRLMASGAMWNAFLISATGRALLQLFRRHLRALHAGLVTIDGDPEEPPGAPAASRPFQSLPTHDLSRDLLTPASSNLRVVRVPPCGWTDLGTPTRLEEWLASQLAPLSAGGLGPA